MKEKIEEKKSEILREIQENQEKHNLRTNYEYVEILSECFEMRFEERYDDLIQKKYQ